MANAMEATLAGCGSRRCCHVKTWQRMAAQLTTPSRQSGLFTILRTFQPVESLGNRCLSCRYHRDSTPFSIDAGLVKLFRTPIRNHRSTETHGTQWEEMLNPLRSYEYLCGACIDHFASYGENARPPDTSSAARCRGCSRSSPLIRCWGGVPQHIQQYQCHLNRRRRRRDMVRHRE